jgi:hypothetical protein
MEVILLCVLLGFVLGILSLLSALVSLEQGGHILLLFSNKYRESEWFMLQKYAKAIKKS